MKFAHIRVSEYFTFAEQIFHSEAISLARRANFVEKSTCLRKCFFLAGIAGLEPANTGVKVLCLNRLGDIPMQNIVYHIFRWVVNRTLEIPLNFAEIPARLDNGDKPCYNGLAEGTTPITKNRDR